MRSMSCEANHCHGHCTGFQRLYLNGISYGSTVSLVYMQYFPVNVAVAVLQGVTWPGISSMYDSSWVAAEHVASRVNKDCDASNDCPFDDPFGDREGFMEKLSAGSDNTRLWEIADTWDWLARDAGIDGMTHLPLFHHVVAKDDTEVLDRFLDFGRASTENLGYDEPTRYNITFQYINTCLDHGPLFSNERLDAYFEDSPTGLLQHWERHCSNMRTSRCHGCG